ncbi:MAG: DUF1836 domain-containing protein [Clostridia bacterium]|nr:DUF1836 domain-containing protein [Clostridia bacterium]
MNELQENSVPKLHILRWKEIPDVGLYMEQLLSLIDKSMGAFFHEVGELPLTKSMINNYVKAGFVDAPVNKKYSRKSIVMIIVIYIMKTCYSPDEINKLINMGMDINQHNYELTYERFCTAIENAVNNVFSGEINVKYVYIEGRENKYLMENFALSFACRYYTKKTFLR